MPNFNRIPVFRMTHVQNIAHILEHGITHRNSERANPDYVSIGDGSLIGTRDAKQIWVNNGETFSFDHAQITLGNFTPFYFGSRMPMLYVIQKGFNGVKKRAAEEIVYCGCLLQSIIDSGLSYYFTDGHATDNFSSCYDQSKVNEIENIVDFKAVKVTDWTAARDLKRKMEAELLVAGDVPVGCIAAFACYNEAAKQELIRIGVDESLIHIRPNYYF